MAKINSSDEENGVFYNQETENAECDVSLKADDVIEYDSSCMGSISPCKKKVIYIGLIALGLILLSGLLAFIIYCTVEVRDNKKIVECSDSKRDGLLLREPINNNDHWYLYFDIFYKKNKVISDYSISVNNITFYEQDFTKDNFYTIYETCGDHIGYYLTQTYKYEVVNNVLAGCLITASDVVGIIWLFGMVFGIERIIIIIMQPDEFESTDIQDEMDNNGKIEEDTNID